MFTTPYCSMLSVVVGVIETVCAGMANSAISDVKTPLKAAAQSQVSLLQRHAGRTESMG